MRSQAEQTQKQANWEGRSERRRQKVQCTASVKASGIGAPKLNRVGEQEEQKRHPGIEPGTHATSARVTKMARKCNSLIKG